MSWLAFVKSTQTRLPLPPALATSLYDALRIRCMLGDRTFDPPHFYPDISIQTGGFLPKTLASPWTRLSPASYREPVARLRHLTSLFAVTYVRAAGRT